MTSLYLSGCDPDECNFMLQDMNKKSRSLHLLIENVLKCSHLTPSIRSQAQNVTRASRSNVMQLLTLNFLIMFDVVFIFFLFLIAVICVLSYMPKRKRQEVTEEDIDDDVIPPPPLFDDAIASTSRDTYVVIPPPMENARAKNGCPIHVV